MDSAKGNSSAVGRRSGVERTANTASWLLVLAFVSLVLSVALPAMMEGGGGDWSAALFFMLGMTATLVGTGLAVAASASRPRAVLGGLVMLTGLVLLFGLVPSLAALAVVLLGVAIEIGSMPAL